MLRMQRCSVCGRRTGRNLWCVAVLFLLGSLVSGDAGAQSAPEVVYQDMGVIGLGTMAVTFPSIVYRPIESMSVRPGGDAAGMGGAYLAVAEGVGAVGWSPSGLASLTHSEILFDGYVRSAGGSASGYPDSVDVPQQPPLLITQYSMNVKNSMQAGFVGAATPLFSTGSINVVGAVSWRRFGETARPEEAITDLAFGRERSFPVVFTVDIRETGVIESFSPTVAVQFGSLLSLGANLNILRGRLISSYEERLSSGGMPMTGHGEVSLKYSGLVPDLGVGMSLMRGRLRTAARFTPSYTLEVRGGQFFTRSINAPNFPIYHTHGKLSGYDLDVPSAIGVGIAVRPFHRLLLAADYNVQNWSESELTYTDALTENPVVAGMNPDEEAPFSDLSALPLDDVTTLHIGAEFLLFDWSWAQVPVRMGFQQVPLNFRSPSNDDILLVETEGPGGALVRQPLHSGSFNGDPVKADALSFGVSLNTGSFSYNLGVESYSYTEKKWFFDSVYDPVMNPRSRLVEHKRQITRMRLSSTVRF